MTTGSKVPSPHRLLARLIQGRKNLRALKIVHAKETTSPNGKKIMAKMMIDQEALNNTIEKMLMTEPSLTTGPH
jgi:hypothetical protein